MSRPDTTDAGQENDFMQPLSDVDQTRRNHESSYLDLLSDIENLRKKRQTHCVQFLNELIPLLEAARKVNRELDFHTAHRFNALDYLRYDELGLSKIIADLLDPSAVHGQGTAFLEAMLELLSIATEGAESQHHKLARELRRSLDRAKIHVKSERAIDNRKRIDISVEIRVATGDRYCLAFENKPYADDQLDQCNDYLEFLNREYGNRFLLVYSPPRLWMPSESSLPNPDRWEGHFCVLPYTSIVEAEGYDELPDGSESKSDEIADQSDAEPKKDALSKFVVGRAASLADWFGISSARSNAERMRWFLKEAQRFCHQHFGGSVMTDTEARYIKEHLEKNPEHAQAAYAVARAWPDYLHGVCERFLTQIDETVRNKLAEQKHELTIACEYRRTGWSQRLSIYKEGWMQYEGKSSNNNSGMRTSIYLESDADQTDSLWGVRRAKSNHDMTPDERTRQKNLEERLAGNRLSNPTALYLHSAQPKYARWSEIVGELAQELDKGGGEITNYYVDGLLDFVTNALDSIDAEELES